MFELALSRVAIPCGTESLPEFRELSDLGRAGDGIRLGVGETWSMLHELKVVMVRLTNIVGVWRSKIWRMKATKRANTASKAGPSYSVSDPKLLMGDRIFVCCLCRCLDWAIKHLSLRLVSVW